jgi:hypothetical protein
MKRIEIYNASTKFRAITREKFPVAWKIMILKQMTIYMRVIEFLSI